MLEANQTTGVQSIENLVAISRSLDSVHEVSDDLDSFLLWTEDGPFHIYTVECDRKCDRETL